MINSRYCFNCNKVYKIDERSHSEYCHDCQKLLAEHDTVTQSARMHYTTTKPFCRVVQDPGDSPLCSGLSLSREEYNFMLDFGSFTPGTILRDKRGRMVTV